MVGRYLESDLTALSLEVRRGDGFTGLFASGSNPDLRHAVDHALQTVHSLPVDPSTIAGEEVSPRTPQARTHAVCTRRTVVEGIRGSQEEGHLQVHLHVHGCTVPQRTSEVQRIRVPPPPV